MMRLLAPSLGVIILLAASCLLVPSKPARAAPPVISAEIFVHLYAPGLLGYHEVARLHVIPDIVLLPDRLVCYVRFAWIDGRVETSPPLLLGSRLSSSFYQLNATVVFPNGTLLERSGGGMLGAPLYEDLSMRVFFIRVNADIPYEHLAVSAPCRGAVEATLILAASNVTLSCGCSDYRFRDLRLRIYLLDLREGGMRAIASFEAVTPDGKVLKASGELRDGGRVHLYIKLDGHVLHPVIFGSELTIIVLIVSLYVLYGTFTRLRPPSPGGGPR